MLFDVLCIVSRQGARNNVANMIIIKTNGLNNAQHPLHPPIYIYIYIYVHTLRTTTTTTINSYLIILFIQNKDEYNMPCILCQYIDFILKLRILLWLQTIGIPFDTITTPAVVAIVIAMTMTI